MMCCYCLENIGSFHCCCEHKENLQFFFFFFFLQLNILYKLDIFALLAIHVNHTGLCILEAETAVGIGVNVHLEGKKTIVVVEEDFDN